MMLCMMKLVSTCGVLVSLSILWGCQPIHAMAVDMPIPEELPVSTANLNIIYKTNQDTHDHSDKLSLSKQQVSESFSGWYAIASPIVPEFGRLIHVVSIDGGNHGCLPLINAPTEGKWIALIERGNCKFHDKVINAAWIHNASAVIIYDREEAPDLLIMHHFIDDVVSVFISMKDGQRLAEVVDSEAAVYMNISLHKVEIYDTVSGTSKKTYQVQPLLIISVTMITCLITALTALLVCGIRRTRSQHKKTTRRHIVFTVNDAAAHQHLLVSDPHVHDYMLEPNNNDPNHNVVSFQCNPRPQ